MWPQQSALISSGVEIAKVSLIMGHGSISVTNDLYGNLVDEEVEASKRARRGYTVAWSRISAALGG